MIFRRGQKLKEKSNVNANTGDGIDHCYNRQVIPLCVSVDSLSVPIEIIVSQVRIKMSVFFTCCLNSQRNRSYFRRWVRGGDGEALT